jgi:hypothetical protein
MPTEVGTQTSLTMKGMITDWIPACAGMTKLKGVAVAAEGAYPFRK